MSGPTMIVLIVLITAIAGVMRAKHGVIRTGRGKEEVYIGRDEMYVRPQDDGEAERLRAEMRGLKDRIAVLERIVTDSDHNRSLALEREIDALRDREARQ